MNSEVKTISTENGKIKEVVCMENGEEKIYKGDIFMSSMPVNDLVAGMKGSPIPELVEKSAKRPTIQRFCNGGTFIEKIKSAKSDKTENIKQHCTGLLDLRSGYRSETGTDTDI